MVDASQRVTHLLFCADYDFVGDRARNKGQRASGVRAREPDSRRPSVDGVYGGKLAMCLEQLRLQNQIQSQVLGDRSVMTCEVYLPSVNHMQSLNEES